MLVSDEGRLIRNEGGIAEDMVGVNVGIDHVADRHAGPLPDSQPEAPAVFQAAAGIDDCDAAFAYDEADIGDRAFIGRRSFLMDALMDKQAGRQLLYR